MFGDMGILKITQSSTNNTVSYYDKAKNEQQEKDEKFNDTIWKHRIYGNLVRCKRLVRTTEDSMWNLYTTEVIRIERGNSTVIEMDIHEFEVLYERVGKCKYSDKELNDMKFVLE